MPLDRFVNRVQLPRIMDLTGKQRRHLRALGHNLDAIVHVGKGGITDGVVGAVNQALEDHELIKVKVLEESPLDRKEVAEALAERCNAFMAQLLGRVVLLYRQHPDNPEIVLPAKPAESVSDEGSHS
jgi:RNA-binding protein